MLLYIIGAVILFVIGIIGIICMCKREDSYWDWLANYDLHDEKSIKEGSYVTSKRDNEVYVVKGIRKKRSKTVLDIENEHRVIVNVDIKDLTW